MKVTNFILEVNFFKETNIENPFNQETNFLLFTLEELLREIFMK